MKFQRIFLFFISDFPLLLPVLEVVSLCSFCLFFLFSLVVACGFFQLIERNYKLQPMLVSVSISITWITASLHVSLEYLSLFFILQPPVIVCVRNLLVPWNVCCSVVQLLKSSITFPPSSSPSHIHPHIFQNPKNKS